MTQTEEFMFQNVAYRPIVYKAGTFGRLRGILRSKIKTILPVAHSLDSAFNRDNSPCTLGTDVQIVSDSSRCDLQNLIGGLLQSKK